MTLSTVRIKRIYDPPEDSDGYRVLVDRLWPRGVSKERAQLDEWLKDIAPSSELRRWFDHKPERFAEFQARYEEELRQNPEIATLRAIIDSHSQVTLLYAAHDPAINQAIILLNYLQHIN